MAEDELRQYLQLMEIVQNFRGADAYVLDAVARVSAMPPKVRRPVIEKQSDVASLLMDLSLNRL